MANRGGGPVATAATGRFGWYPRAGAAAVAAAVAAAAAKAWPHRVARPAAAAAAAAPSAYWLTSLSSTISASASVLLAAVFSNLLAFAAEAASRVSASVRSLGFWPGLPRLLVTGSA